MTEKVDNCAFASETKMLEMISNIESLYALHFTDGDKKVARERLRDTMQGNPQHTRSFRSGLYTGLGIAALSRVIFLSFQEETREAIPAWAALLQLDVRTMIDPRQYVEIPSFAFLTLSYCTPCFYPLNICHLLILAR
ncbi:uncharacterized protein EI90DRAFT_2400601 [Cantharellus anzutake]|uniref:uncharacterized protein n=1 Tax=Cantharellus anzutake TaxID=1750568 RepID=UPI001905D33F|nr:uncharacterized protein EI90DRAFT_2400601 [Cantharellus anzutake]KAF8322843.1 hypothetical protein EI90DRAFT_2400601 [Cantharellus anzutake]